MNLRSWFSRHSDSSLAARKSTHPNIDRRPSSAGLWIIPATLAIGTTVTTTVWWLLSSLPPLTGAAAATAQIEIIRTALAAGAGIGGAITLMLALRRQRHQESIAASTIHDASERRLTELYVKAVEQLGNAQAPVRLGGLYALERLGQDNPGHRQTIVDVICAYLRMPYIPPSDNRHEKIRGAQKAARSTTSGRASPKSTKPDAREEMQVRLAAQQILQQHLREPPPRKQRRFRHVPAQADPRFWPGMRLNLAGAALTDFEFSGCRVAGALFDGATFYGRTDFNWVTIEGHAIFHQTIFHGDVLMSFATFGGLAMFGEATFKGQVHCGGTAFSETAFSSASFAARAEFGGATFHAPVDFQGTIFEDTVSFRGAMFRTAYFNEAIFHNTASFSRATADVGISFAGAIFYNAPEFDEVTAADEGLRLEGAYVAEKALGGAWPLGWRLTALPSGGAVIEGELPGVE